MAKKERKSSDFKKVHFYRRSSTENEFFAQIYFCTSSMDVIIDVNEPGRWIGISFKVENLVLAHVDAIN